MTNQHELWQASQLLLASVSPVKKIRKLLLLAKDLSLTPWMKQLEIKKKKKGQYEATFFKTVGITQQRTVIPERKQTR